MHKEQNASSQHSPDRQAPAVKSMGLLFDEAGLAYLQEFRDFAEEVGTSGGNLEVLGCFPKKQQAVNFSGMSLTPKSLNLLGRIKDKEVQAFVSRPFDLLICFTEEEGKLLRKVLRGSQAALKVGRLREGVQEYDLAIASSMDEVGIFLQELKKYLKILKKTA